jgi:hypothetical protein
MVFGEGHERVLERRRIQDRAWAPIIEDARGRREVAAIGVGARIGGA